MYLFSYLSLTLSEHGAFNQETVADLCRHAVNIGLTPLVRICEITYAQIAQPLDAGAQGLMIPRVTSGEQVRLEGRGERLFRIVGAFCSVVFYH
jgi:2-keto-3-deoxy-L-rhamnonate aldolase RhmA